MAMQMLATSPQGLADNRLSTWAVSQRGRLSGRTCLLVACISLAVLANCGGRPRAGQLFELVPAASVVAVNFDWRRVKADDALLRLGQQSGLERVFAELGVAGADIDELMVFSDGRAPQTGSTAIILRGTYGGQSLLERLLTRGWHEQAQADVTLYINPAGDSYCGLHDDLLVAGTRAAVLHVIKSEDDENLTSQPTYEKLVAQLSASNAPIFVVAAAPQQLQDIAQSGLQLSSVPLDLVGLGAIGNLIQRLDAVRGVGCAIEHEADGYPVELVAVMRDEEAASLVSGTLELAQGLAAIVPRDRSVTAGAQQVESLSHLTVTHEAEVLSLKLTMTAAQLQAH